MRIFLQLSGWVFPHGARATAAVLLFGLVGCDRPVAIDSAPAELRGEPIGSAVVRVAVSPTPLSTATDRTAALAATVVPVPPAAGSTSPPTESLAVPLDTSNGFAEVGFEKLSGYKFEVPDDLLAPASNEVAQATARTEAQIPKEVKALDRRRVALKGFMLPLKVEKGGVTELLIMKDQSMCCFGAVPKINEWVSVKMIGAGVKPFMDRPVTFYGTLHVGETRENGYLVGIYSMDGEKMEEPKDL